VFFTARSGPQSFVGIELHIGSVCWFEESYHHQSREDRSPADAHKGRFDLEFTLKRENKTNGFESLAFPSVSSRVLFQVECILPWILWPVSHILNRDDPGLGVFCKSCFDSVGGYHMGSVSFVEKERLPLKVGLKWVSRTYGLGEGDSVGDSLVG